MSASPLRLLLLLAVCSMVQAADKPNPARGILRFLITKDSAWNLQVDGNDADNARNQVKIFRERAGSAKEKTLYEPIDHTFVPHDDGQAQGLLKGRISHAVECGPDRFTVYFTDRTFHGLRITVTHDKKGKIAVDYGPWPESGKLPSKDEITVTTNKDEPNTVIFTAKKDALS